MHDHVFVCYAGEDKKFALRIGKKLKERGIHVWLDQWDIPDRAGSDETIDAAIRDCGQFVTVLSPAAVGSKEMRSQLRPAVDEGKWMAPVIRQMCEIPRRLRSIQHMLFAAGGPAVKDSLRGLVTASGGKEPLAIEDLPARRRLNTSSAILALAVLAMMSTLCSPTRRGQLGRVPSASAVPQVITFEKDYGGSGAETGIDVKLTSDGGYIVLGTTESGGITKSDLYLMKTDSLGDTLWTRTYGSSDDDYARGVQPTDDGGYLLYGDTALRGEPVSPVDRFLIGIRPLKYGGYRSYDYLIKVDSTGEVQSTGPYQRSPTCPDGLEKKYTSTRDGGKIRVTWRAELIKEDSEGEREWQRSYGDTATERLTAVQQTRDGGYVAVGSTVSPGTGLEDVYLIKIDSQGSIKWTMTYGGAADDWGNAVRPTRDGGYIVVGCTESWPDRSTDVYVIKTDSRGVVEWEKPFGGASLDRGEAVQQTSDGGYIIVGETWSRGAGWTNVYLIKTDSLGRVCK